MEALLQEGTTILPTINFNPNNGELSITGRSIPEHPVKFYQPIDEWVASYVASNPSKIHLLVHLDYLNTHSTECILVIMKKLEAYGKSSGVDATITWQYDEYDEDMLTLGEDLASIIQLPVRIEEIKEN